MLDTQTCITLQKMTTYLNEKHQAQYELQETLNINNFDHVIMNPPFHIGRKVELGLGLAFLSIAKNILTKGGTLWMVYNQELPYEKTMNSLFTNYQFLNKTKTYNVIRAKKT